jgi:hypothetical protein
MYCSLESFATIDLLLHRYLLLDSYTQHRGTEDTEGTEKDKRETTSENCNSMDGGAQSSAANTESLSAFVFLGDLCVLCASVLGLESNRGYAP